MTRKIDNSAEIIFPADFGWEDAVEWLEKRGFNGNKGINTFFTLDNSNGKICYMFPLSHFWKRFKNS